MSPLPAHLAEAKHWDWPWPFSLIPRKWTSFDWGEPTQVLGKQKETRKGAPAPIGEPNSRQFSTFFGAPWYAWPIAWYVALSLGVDKDGKYRHFRFGARWDDVDNYVTWPAVASRKYSLDPNADTSTGVMKGQP